MAVIKLPWPIEFASGRMGDIVYCKRKNTQYYRKHTDPSNPKTIKQNECRGSFSRAVKTWQQLPGEEKQKFADRAENINMSGYNLFISGFMKNEKAKKEEIPVSSGAECLLLSAIKSRPLPVFSGRPFCYPSVSSSLPLRFGFVYVPERQAAMGEIGYRAGPFVILAAYTS